MPRILDKAVRPFHRTSLRTIGLIAVLSSSGIAVAQPVPDERPNQNRGFYIAASGGVWLQSDVTLSGSELDEALIPDFITDGFATLDLDQETGFAANLGLGYDFGRIRFELDFGYRRTDNGTTTLSFIGDDPSLTSTDFLAAFEDEFGFLPDMAIPSTGSYQTFTGMGNLLVDFPIGRRFTPYVGGGLGIAVGFLDSALDISADDPDDTVVLEGGIGGGFAYQILAGTAISLSRHWVLDIGYRYLDSADFDLDDEDLLVSGEVSGHSIQAGLRIQF